MALECEVADNILVNAADLAGWHVLRIEVLRERFEHPNYPTFRALCRAIKVLNDTRAEFSHSMQKLSDEIEELIAAGKEYEETFPPGQKGQEFVRHCKAVDAIRRHILPKPDPVEVALADLGIDPEELRRRGVRLVELGK